MKGKPASVEAPNYTDSMFSIVTIFKKPILLKDVIDETIKVIDGITSEHLSTHILNSVWWSEEDA